MTQRPRVARHRSCNSSPDHVAVAVAREAHGPEAVDHGRDKSPLASSGVIAFGDLKEPSWGANIASAEGVTEARRRAVSVPVRRGSEDG
jgi:hypothetical protein